MNKFINWIKSVFGRIGEIWATFKSSKAGSVIISALNDQALNSEAIKLVSDLADQSITSSQKHEAAVTALISFGQSRGWSLSTSLAKTLIELAYQAYQLKKGA